MKLRRLPFLLLGIITAVLIAATVVEKLYGADTAMDDIYLSPWMTALWTATAATALAEVLARRKAMGFGSLLLHISLVMILAGAATTHFIGLHGHISLTTGEPATDIWTLRTGEKATFPFKISLTDCGTEYHASEVAARDYYSTIEADGDQYRISMNNVLDLKGYRLTQSALSAESSTLSVSYDPWGRGISFAAYGLLFISMILVLIRSRRFHKLLRRATVILIILIPLTSSAQPKTLQKPLARTYGKLYVVSGGRICPAQTVAKEFCSKIYGKDTYRGLTAEQVLTGWIYYYSEWKHEPMITLKSSEAIRLLGKKQVSLAELFTRDGYKLEPLLHAPTVSRDLLADDEKVTLISAVAAGRLPRQVGADNFQVNRLLEDIAADIATGRYNNANTHLKELREVQRTISPGRLPSENVIKAELIYNDTYYPLLAAIAAFLGGIAGAIRLRKTALTIGIITTLYVSYILILRWITGGHIPLATGYETMLSLAWFALLAAVLLSRRIPAVLPLGLIVGGASMMVAMMSARNPAVSPLVPVLESRLLSLHVMLVMCSYALFAIIALNSALALAGRAKTDTSRLLLYPALFLLGAGIFVGAIWADRSWGRYWGWDPKETWALITFIIYAFPLHDSTFPTFRKDRFTDIYLLLAFLSVLMTYFGVNYILGGLHSYGAA